jgi:hypothetical protein
MFNVHGSVHRKNILIYIQQDATLQSLYYLETALHASGGTTNHHLGAQTTVSTASGICQTVTSTCRDRGM